MNLIFSALILIAFLFAASAEWAGEPRMAALSSGLVSSAKGAVELALGLVGVMALFLGLMKVVEAAGLLRAIARLMQPLLCRLFPAIPPEHPAMGAMVLNLSANALGLGNAATPFGIRAMQALDQLNRHKGVASNEMVLFLAINTSSVTLLPTGVIALRAAAGSADPAGIVATTLFATLCSTTTAIVMALLLQRLWRVSAPESGDFVPNLGDSAPSEGDHVSAPLPFFLSLTILLLVVLAIPLLLVYGSLLSPWLLPTLVASFILLGVLRRVAVYDLFVEGAREGFEVAVRIIPYLVAILVAVAMLRASGALEAFVQLIAPVTSPWGLPAEAVPMALLRPLSGSGAYGVVAATINDPAIGPDSYIGYLVSTLQGSTETTFYVLAVYFGAVQIRRIRHALWCALSADLVAIIAAVAATRWMLGV
jgi:spore maturation protein SpmA